MSMSSWKKQQRRTVGDKPEISREVKKEIKQSSFISYVAPAVLDLHKSGIVFNASTHSHTLF